MKATVLLLATLLFLLHVQTYGSSSQINIEEICKQVVNADHTDYCIQTLKNNPKAQTADQKELATTVFDLTLQRFKKTSKKVQKLIESREKDEGHTALRICDQAYSKAVDKLEQVPARYKKGGFMASATQLSAGIDQAESCIDAFEKTGAEPLLAKENEECLTLVMLTSAIMEKIERS